MFSVERSDGVSCNGGFHLLRIQQAEVTNVQSCCAALGALQCCSPALCAGICEHIGLHAMVQSERNTAGDASQENFVMSLYVQQVGVQVYLQIVCQFLG